MFEKKLQYTNNIECLDEDKKQEIINFVYENISVDEDRIQENMLPDCEVSIVVPAYGERQNILHSIMSLTEQKDVLPSQFEMIIVVNNPPSKPEKSSNENDLDYQRKIDHYYSSLEDNQQTIKLIEHLQNPGSQTDVEISEKENIIIEKIRNSGIRVFVIDKSTGGKTLPKEFANVGGARNRGVAEAVERFYKNGKNGIIAQSDADSKFAPDYVVNLIQTFNRDKELIGLGGELDFEVTAHDEKSLRVDYSMELQFQYESLLSDLTNENRSQKKRVYFSGANMASRAYQTAFVGGVPKIAGGEDPAFGERLAKIGKIDRVENVKVLTAHRFSPRTDVNCGNGQTKLKLSDRIEQGLPIEVKTIENLKLYNTINDRLRKLINNETTDSDKFNEVLSALEPNILNDDELILLIDGLKNTDGLNQLAIKPQHAEVYYKIDAAINNIHPLAPLVDESQHLISLACLESKIAALYKKEKARLLEEEDRITEERIKMLKVILEVKYRSKTMNLTEDLFLELLQENKDEIGLSGDDFLEIKSNQIDLKTITEIVNQANNVEEAIDEIKSKMPNTYLEPEKNQLLLRVIELRAINKTMEQVNKRS